MYSSSLILRLSNKKKKYGNVVNVNNRTGEPINKGILNSDRGGSYHYPPPGSFKFQLTIL